MKRPHHIKTHMLMIPIIILSTLACLEEIHPAASGAVKPMLGPEYTCPNCSPTSIPPQTAALDAVKPMLGPEYTCPNCNLIIISFDTLRQDRLSHYGYPRKTTPNIDAFSEEGLDFIKAYSPAPSTLLAHASLFTSLYPTVHNADVTLNSSLSEKLNTLAEILRQSGYRTVSFNGGVQLLPIWNLDQGFEKYVSKDRSFKDNFAASLSWLVRNNGSRFFLFVHGYDIHAPYVHPGSFYLQVNPNFSLSTYSSTYSEVADRCFNQITNNSCTQSAINSLDKERGEAIREVRDDIENCHIRDKPLATTKCNLTRIVALYDDGVYYSDNHFGVFLDGLREMGLYNNTVIIVMADHGEEFSEHGTVANHGHTLYNELLRVPLIVRVPDAAPNEISEPVSTIDVMPTILSILHVPTDGLMQGVDLTKNSHHGDIFSEFRYSRAGKKMLISGDMKVIVTYDSGNASTGVETYNLTQDPLERNPIKETNETKPLIDSLLAKLENQILVDEETKHTLYSTNPRVEIDEETKKQLQSLGYM